MQMLVRAIGVGGSVLTEAQLRKRVKRKNWGEWIEYHHHSLADAEVYEIWTYTNENKEDKNDWIPQTRFVFEEDGKKQDFDYFVNLIRYLDKRFLVAARDGAELELKIKREVEALNNKRFVLRVVGVAFLGAAIAMIVVFLLHSDEIFRNNLTKWLAAITVASLVSSGLITLGGTWRTIKLPKALVDLAAVESETAPQSGEPIANTSEHP
jgi:hypothetical protein